MFCLEGQVNQNALIFCLLTVTVRFKTQDLKSKWIEIYLLVDVYCADSDAARFGKYWDDPRLTAFCSRSGSSGLVVDIKLLAKY